MIVKQNDRLLTNVNYLYQRRLQGIMVVVFINTNILSKMINTTTMIPCRRVSQRELGIELINLCLQNAGTLQIMTTQYRLLC